MKALIKEWLTSRNPATCPHGRSICETDESKSVGQSDDGGESKGHESGRRIVEILEKDDEGIGQDDVDHMRRVVSYVHRHQAQEPEEDVQDSRWRYSLMNWGHDHLK
jgi:Protein of unknown function (DUF3140)